MDDLMPIGEFAARSGLSQKMLRTYAAAGLLTPAAVDPATGYRYYAGAQVETARLIGWLRRAGMPLAEIAGLLADPRVEALAAYDRALTAELGRRRTALGEAAALLAGGTPPVRTAPSAGPDTGGSTMTTLSAASATDTGLVRPANQDAVLTTGSLFAVADGWGELGAEASQLALERLAAGFDGTTVGLEQAVAAANRAVCQLVSGRPGEAGSGTTLAAIGAVGPCGALRVVNLGDSRVYAYRSRSLELLSADHTVVAELVAAGRLAEDQAPAHPERHLLTRSLGIGPELEPHTGAWPAEEGDRLLVCSDGLFAEVAPDEIALVLDQPRPPAETAAELVRRANGNGGRDNTSVVVVDVAAA